MGFILPLNVLAEGVKLTTDKEDLTIGDEVVVTATVDSDKKLYALMATLNYDKAVFEEIDERGFIIDNDGVLVVYNEENNKFGIINKAGEIPSELFKIKLRVKKNANVGNANITLTNISSSDGKDKYSYEKASTKVLVTRDAKDGEEIPVNEEKEFNDQEEQEITVKTNKPVMISSGVLIIIIGLVTLYLIKQRKNKNLIIGLICTMGVLVIAVGALLIINMGKKDVNNDGKKDYNDAKDIIKYLIEMQGEETPDNQHKPDYDVNNDGKVDVNDVGGSTENTTDKTRFVITLADNNITEWYIERGKVTLDFAAIVSPSEIIKEAMVDGVKYPVVNNGTYYSVEVSTPMEAGAHNFKFTKVTLSNGREIDINYETTREILKQEPYVDMFNFDEKTSTLTFKLEDKDEAFIDGHIVIADKDGNEVVNQAITTNNSIKYDFEYEEEYSVMIFASFDLDTNALNNITGEKNRVDNSPIYSHVLSIDSNYNFTISDVVITDAVEKGDVPTITFTSTNNKGYVVEYIVIDGIRYAAANEYGKNTYTVKLEGMTSDTYGKKHIDIDKVEISNYKVFERGKDYNLNTLSYTVLKNAPTVEDIKLEVDKDKEEIIVNYQVNDKDSTLNSLDLYLMDANNKLVGIVNNVENGNRMPVSYKGNMAGGYKVKFLANYNLGTDRHIYTDVNVGEESITTQKDIKISNVYVGIVNNNNNNTNPFPTKGQSKYQIKVTLEVSDEIKAKYNGFSGVTINGLNFDGGANGIGDTTISFTVPSESGVVDLRIDRVKLSSESYQGVSQAFFAVEPYTAQIDVLKDKPTIKNLEVVEEDYSSGSVKFRFEVVDDKGGFKKGYIELNKEKQDITLGVNEITFNNVTKDKDLDLIFFGDYDLDTNTLKGYDESKNSYQNQELFKTVYGLYGKDIYDSVIVTDVSSNQYLEKQQEVTLNFKVTADIPLVVKQVVIDGKIYDVITDDNTYQVVIPGYYTSGVKEIVIEEIILDNGKKVTLKSEVKKQVEVLKDHVELYDFKYEVQEDSIKLKLNLKDDDKAILDDVSKSVVVKIYNEKNELLDSLPFKEELEFKKRDNILRYYVIVEASYDRDITRGGDNIYQNIQLYSDVISIDENNIAIKDITDVTLYMVGEDKSTAVDKVNVTDLENNLNNYFVKIAMADLPSIHAKIKKVVRENGRLILVLDYEYTVKDKSEDLRIDFGPINDDVAINEARPETVEQLIARIKENPGATIVLTHDYDFANVKVETADYFDVEFSGTFDGNGHTIKNLNKPLFKAIMGGTVENLRLENINLTTTDAHGALANNANNATIKKVYASTISKSNSGFDSGGLIGKATNNTLIEECRVTNLKLSVGTNLQRNGGLVGSLENSKINNSYVVGSVSGNWNYIGGLVGLASGSDISNSLTKVNVGGALSCGFVCSTGGTTFTNNVSLSTGGTNAFVNNYKVLNNNYYLVNEKGETQNATTLIAITQNEVNKELFTDKAKFNEDVWAFKNISYDNLPIFIDEIISKVDKDAVGEDYDEDKELLYSNLMLLMPFYDSKKIVSSAKNIEMDNLLAKEEIEHVIPVDDKGNIVTYLTTDNPKNIKKIIIVFKNQKSVTYEVKYDKSYDMVASYRISDLMIDYTFNHYVIDSDSQLVNNLTNYLEGLTYEDNLDKLTTTDDSRLYKEYYNDFTRYELKEFVLKYLANSNYAITNKSEAISDYLEREIKVDQKLEKMLYVYNYFKRFYSVDINGIMLNDLILFGSQGFNEGMTPDNITSLYLSDPKNFETNRTSDVYSALLSKYTGYTNIPELLEYFVKVLSTEDVADWYAKQFKGYIVELGVEDQPEIMYRLWDHIKNKDVNTNVSWYNYALPILTIPENGAYIISSPVQFVIGSQRTYINDPSDPQEHEKLVQRIDTYAQRMIDYYTAAARILDDAQVFNDIHTIQIDKRYTYENGIMTFQNPYSTQEPFHKYFIEAIGQWAYNDYNAATANGAYVIWRVEGLMDGDLTAGSEYTFHTWSHESAHNIDARLFLRNNGRRFDAGGEDYADGNLTQSFGDGDIVMNLSRHFDKNALISANLDPDRIDSQQEIYDFYNKLFDTLYIMDYLEGQAFLKLTAEEQAALAVQVSYPRESTNTLAGHEYLQRQHTVYKEVSVEDIKAMNLTSMESLYNNKLVMWPGVILSTYTTNRYGGENIYKVRWYQPHNDKGRPDSYSLKWFAYEMLGYAGYDEGYIEYYSNIHYVKDKVANVASDGVSYVYDNNGNPKYSDVNYKTDLMALRKITGQDDITFKDYKLGRFDKVEDNLASIQIIDVNEYFTKFYNALKEDAATVIAARTKAYELYPGDEKEQVDKRNKYITDNKAKNFVKSTDVRRSLYYTLKNGTNDFSGLVYDANNQKEVKPFTVPSN